MQRHDLAFHAARRLLVSRAVMVFSLGSTGVEIRMDYCS
jgi:hypothetical protein